jgi:hypothetical protein
VAVNVFDTTFGMSSIAYEFPGNVNGIVFAVEPRDTVALLVGVGECPVGVIARVVTMFLMLSLMQSPELAGTETVYGTPELGFSMKQHPQPAPLHPQGPAIIDSTRSR